MTNVFCKKKYHYFLAKASLVAWATSKRNKWKRWGPDSIRYAPTEISN